MAHMTADEIIDRCPELPPLPSSALKLIGSLLAHDYDVAQVEEIIRTDAALTAAVLRLANSAAFGAPGRTFDVSRSIARIGAVRLSDLVLSQTSAKILGERGAAYGLRRRELWRGGVGGAIAARRLAEAHAGADPGLAYVAGLLRDIGKLVIEVVFGDHAAAIASDAQAPSASFDEAEAAAFGVDHADLGAALAARWSLPDPIVRAIRLHHAPPPPGDPGHDRLIDIVHAADIVCLWAGLAVGDDGLEYRLAPHVQDDLGLDLHEAEEVIAATYAAVTDLELVLDPEGERAA